MSEKTAPLSFLDKEAEILGGLEGKMPAVFLDYDGSLAPLVADYRKAFMKEDMRAALYRLSRCCPVAIVSGRDVEALRLFIGLEGIFYAGSHGFEVGGPEGERVPLQKALDFLPMLAEAERRLHAALCTVAGAEIETKRFCIAVHYRKVASCARQGLMETLDHVLTSYPALRRRPGKAVIEIQPDLPWDKGRAVLWLIDRLNLDRPDIVPLYIGDDHTDEDAFRALKTRGLSFLVREGDYAATAADYTLVGLDAVKRLLDSLADLVQKRGIALKAAQADRSASCGFSGG